MELYSYNQYRGYHLFVENTYDEEYTYYEGIAQLNGEDMFLSKSMTGDGAEASLIDKIDAELDEGKY